jgi:hypothetical protein
MLSPAFVLFCWLNRQLAKCFRRVYHPITMNASEKPSPSETPPISAEAFIGIGITIAGLGVLCLLLGWAQHMRKVPTMGWLWLALGVVLLVLGGVAAAFPRSRSRRRLHAPPVSGTGVAPDEDERAREPEEQLY